MLDRTKLREIAKEASEKAYSPYSNAKVGSALEDDQGNFFSGCNIENSSFGATICAERVAISKAISTRPEAKIKHIYVYTKEGWSPCGICRQFICEFADSSTRVIIGDEQGSEKEFDFGDLLPLAFTPDEYNKN